GRVGLPRARRGPPPLAIRPPPGTAATVTRPAPSSRIRGSTTSWSARTGRAAAACNRSRWAAPPRWTASGHRIISPSSPNSSSRARRYARPMFDTALTRILGIDVPIVQAPIGNLTCPQLVTAVSNAGARGRGRDEVGHAPAAGGDPPAPPPDPRAHRQAVRGQPRSRLEHAQAPGGLPRGRRAGGVVLLGRPVRVPWQRPRRRCGGDA